MNLALRYIAGCLLLVLGTGCHSLPQLGRQPMYHNPFPQLTKIAIAPFFNLSTEPAVDGRQFAEAYGNELQMIPGFEVVPVGVVERAMEAHGLSLDNPANARKLAQQLGVDALVIGAVTDYTPYYPPRCGLQIEWYSANPFFHPIPPGYGLPWGTPEEKEIPAPLVLEAEMALAREQLKTQAPPFHPEELLVAPQPLPVLEGQPIETESDVPEADPESPPATAEDGEAVSYQAGRNCRTPDGSTDSIAATDEGGVTEPPASGESAGAIVPPGWPDDRGFFPPAPTVDPGPPIPCDDPVLRHTRMYNGADNDFTNSLSNYYFFRNDERGSQWQGYLTRMPDFIRFCCHRHITEMISARGGVDEGRVVWRWPTSR